MSTVETNQSAAEASNQATGTPDSSTTVNQDTTMNANTTTGTESTDANTNTGTPAGEAAKTGLLRTAYSYSKTLVLWAVAGLIVYFFGAKAIEAGTSFMANPGVWDAVKASVFAGVATAVLMDKLRPVGVFLKAKVWVPFKGLFAKKVKDVASATAEAAASSQAAAAAA